MDPIPISYHENNFNEMMNSDVYLSGYIFEHEGEIAGFAVTSKMYSAEVGGICVWVEDVYIKNEFRSHGLGRELFQLIEEQSPKLSRIRLEVEEGNARAISLYEKLGFKRLPYNQMIKDFK
ncbi:MAG: GNAT family N-acetyltransferase [Clostridiales bacterium]|nr:GNAT family N-acetyltransferase [Clostridiales bacterium]